ncbi:hypothetical protein Tco_0285407 [Tanacetum coccineum]
MWTVSSRLKPEPITNIKIHPKTKPVVIIVYRSTDGRNFDIYKTVAFAPKQASSQTSGIKRKHMELEPEVKVPGLECNRCLPKGVSFVSNMVIKEPEYEIFFTDVYGDQEFQTWNDIHKVGVDSLVSYLVLASTIKTKENARFSQKLRKLIADHPY